MSELNYIANAGQTYMPFQDNTQVETLPYTPLDRPNPEIPELILNDAAREKKWEIQAQTQHFLPGVTAKMLDWFWANMEKCYYLWGPGSHKRFNWVKSPSQYGFLNSVHMISESVAKGHPVFGGNGIEIHRLGLEYFPFTEHLSNVIVEGTFNDLNEFVDMTVHMWEDCEGGSRHITAAVASTTCQEPPHFVKEMLAENPNVKLIAPSATDHSEYEASRWPVFLPQMYELWKGHPDPSQNVQCNLTVEDAEDGAIHYVEKNEAVHF